MRSPPRPSPWPKRLPWRRQPASPLRPARRFVHCRIFFPARAAAPTLAVRGGSLPPGCLFIERLQETYLSGDQLTDGEVGAVVLEGTVRSSSSALLSSRSVVGYGKPDEVACADGLAGHARGSSWCGS